MTANTHRRLTVGPPEDNLPAIIEAIQRDALGVYERAELLVGPLDTLSAIGFVITQALEGLASYWPEPARRDPEMDAALLDLRCQLLVDAPAVAVIQEAVATIARQADKISELLAEIEQLRGYVAKLESERAARTSPVPPYNWLYSDAGDVGDEPAGAGVAVAELEAEEALETEEAATAQPVPTMNWDWQSILWNACPIQITVGQLQNGVRMWTDIVPGVRLSLVRHVAAQLGNPDTKTFDLLRPGWMPTAKTLTQSFKMKWSTLLEIKEPIWP